MDPILNKQYLAWARATNDKCTPLVSVPLQRNYSRILRSQSHHWVNAGLSPARQDHTHLQDIVLWERDPGLTVSILRISSESQNYAHLNLLLSQIRAVVRIVQWQYSVVKTISGLWTWALKFPKALNLRVVLIFQTVWLRCTFIWLVIFPIYVFTCMYNYTHTNKY